jgi:DNA-binding XRE family transcriptional regulator
MKMATETNDLRPWSQIRDRHKNDPEWQAGLAEQRRLLENALKLYELRKSRGATQNELASAIGISQKRVSQIEHTGNPNIETLRAYVKGLGGELEIRAVFPDKIVPFTTT